MRTLLFILSNLIFCSLPNLIRADTPAAHQSTEFVEIGADKSVQNSFLAQLEDIIGDKYKDTWSVTTDPKFPNSPKGFDGFASIFRKNFKSLTASGTAKNKKYETTANTIVITRTGEDPLVFKIVVTGTKFFISKTFKQDIVIKLSSSPQEVMANLKAAIAELKAKAAGSPKSAAVHASGWFVAMIDRAFSPLAFAETVHPGSRSLNPACEIAKVLLYAAAYTGLQEKYKPADLQFLGTLMTGDFKAGE